MEQFSYEGAWDDCALVNVKSVLAKPGLLDKVGHGNVLYQSTLAEGCDAQSLLCAGLIVQSRAQKVPRHVKYMAKQPRGFLGGIVRAMPVM